MKDTVIIFLLLLVFTHLVFAQEKLPVLKANSNLISIKEGDSLYKSVWNVSPETKPDVFVTNPFVGKKQVTFYSDIDSITFLVEPGKKYDFIVLLNGKTAAYTQINTHTTEKPSLQPKLFYTKIDNKINSVTDTIPFEIGKDNGIHIKGKINDSEILDFLFDTGAGMCVITSSLINQKVNLKIDGSQENGGSDGVSTVNTSSKNKLEIGNLVWNNVPLLSIDYKGFPFDAVLGWVVFEDKIVEIDYEKNLLTIHQTLPAISSEYSSLEMKLINGIPYIKCKLVVDGKESEGWFDFDTGSNGTLIIGQNFASKNSLNNVMKSIGTATSKGSTGIEVKQRKVMLPKLKLGNFEMYQIPMSIIESDPNGVTNNENIGNNILKRFNAIIDFKNNLIYLKPNNLFYAPMR